MIQTLEWTDSGVRFIDQTKLPMEETYVTCRTCDQVADVIRKMVVRGAPAIGVAAAMGIALGVKNSKAQDRRRTEAGVRTLLRSHRQNPADGGQSLLGHSPHEG